MRYLKQFFFAIATLFQHLYHYFNTNALNEVEIKDRSARLKFLLRFFPAIFLISYLLALFFPLIGSASSGNFYSVLIVLFETAVGALSGILVGFAWDMVMNRPVGILGGWWLSLWLGIWATISWSAWIAILLTTIGGVALGCGVVKSIDKITIRDLNENRKYREEFKERFSDVKTNKELLEIVNESISFFILFYLLRVVVPKIEQNESRKISIAVVRCVIVSTILLIASIVISSIGKDPWGITWPIWWAVTMGSLAGILAGVTLSHTRNKWADWGVGVGSGIVIGVMLGNFQQHIIQDIIVAITPAIVTAIAWCIAMIALYRGTGSANKARKINLLIFLAGMAWGIVAGYLIGGAWPIIVFLLCYGISYCQLPIWLLSFMSIKTAARKADEASEKNPSEVFVQLHASSVYWDEWEVLSVLDPSDLNSSWSGLGDMMELAVKQDIGQATEILTFIEAERPLHFEVAQSGAHVGFLELIDNEEEALKTQGDISEVIQHFSRLQTLVIKLDMTAIPQWLTLLEDMIVSVTEQDVEQAIEVLPLIKTWQSSKLAAVVAGLRRGFLQLITSEMEPQKTLRDISETPRQFTKLHALSNRLNIFDPDVGSLISDLNELFVLLNDVCQDAIHYLNALRWQVRHDALENMVANLGYIRELVSLPLPPEPSGFSLRRVTSQKLHEMDKWNTAVERENDKRNAVDHWESIAQHEWDKLEQEPRNTDQIKNPYVVGPVLQPGTPLFVGRQDLVQQLEQGLGRGSHRTTFFLNGERRMGKTSTLRQLPLLLDARRFLPIFFDLQAPEMTSRIAAFLGTIAEKMIETMRIADIQIEPLAKEHLKEAQRENEATVYYAFDEWLKHVEQTLEQNNRVVLLSFDEFENLEIAGKDKNLDLHLLLNWFRSVIQNRPQLALLFSGGKSVSEMGHETTLNWSGYFVNVQTFRVSFLREAEAHHLITHPIPDYPIEQIFGMGVVDEITRVTSCHPFLVQAICSSLVDNLNADSRNRVEIQDVAVAVTQVLVRWEDGYFEDLWARSDPEQRACLIALSELGKSDIQQIAQYIHSNKQITREKLQNVRHTLQVLLKRDLASLENETYMMATPIFSQWVERRIGSNS
jgi:hypothetical protein